MRFPCTAQSASDASARAPFLLFALSVTTHLSITTNNNKDGGYHNGGDDDTTGSFLVHLSCSPFSGRAVHPRSRPILTSRKKKDEGKTVGRSAKKM
jgi:hypothetical protein